MRFQVVVFIIKMFFDTVFNFFRFASRMFPYKGSLSLASLDSLSGFNASRLVLTHPITFSQRQFFVFAFSPSKKQAKKSKGVKSGECQERSSSQNEKNIKEKEKKK